MLELFAGVGGAACAWPEAEVVAAMDINDRAREFYQANFSHCYQVREISSVPFRELAEVNADVWWMSPPCQPFTRRGAMRGLQDTRTQALVHVVNAIREVRPDSIALETVIGFEASSAFDLLTETLLQVGYRIATLQLCPSQLGWPNLRPRFYLLASQRTLVDWQPLPSYGQRLADLVNLEMQQDEDLYLDSRITVDYWDALDRVQVERPESRTACFTSGYGKSLLRSGSYLQLDRRLRRFSPAEVARLMGFPLQYRLPVGPKRHAWKLLGNSLSLPAVRYLLAHLPNGPAHRLPWTDASTEYPTTGIRGFDVR